MVKIVQTINLYFIGTAFVYLFAFTSFYTQIPGLYGDRGLLPVRNVFSFDLNKSVLKSFLDEPNIIWFFKYTNLNEELCLELMTLTAMFISFCAIIFYKMRNSITFLILWAFYYSITKLGQTFLWFQWDTLLLESGFLTVVLAPLSVKGRPSFDRKSRDRQASNGHNSHVTHGNGFYQRPSPHNGPGANEEEDFTLKIRFWLIKWLCFRLMFASGLVKLTSKCPSWWALDAMNWHYESQCIPTPLAWYAHQAPPWFQRFSVVATLVIESVLPFLFFSPLRIHRLVSGYAQVFLMVLILLTGNFNFFNLHIIVLHLCLADDRHFRYKDGTDRERSSSILDSVLSFAKFLLVLLPFVVGAPIIASLFGLGISLPTKGTSPQLVNFEISSQINFSQERFFAWLSTAVPVSIWMGAVSLSFEILLCLKKCLVDLGPRFFALLKAILFSNLAIYLFVSSCVPYYNLDYGNAGNSLWPIAHKWYKPMKPYHVANSYGLFRSMTGIGGRPEIVIMGSNDLDKGWQEYEFMYKVGDMAKPPLYLVPHQPRLDWQMWFAALDSYQYNPWLVHLVYKILTNEQDVLELLGPYRPFKGHPPKYVKIDSYTYHYTKFGQHSSDWWTREKVYEYFPPMTKNSPEFIKYLSEVGFQTSKIESHIKNKNLAFWIKKVRTVLVRSWPEPHYLIWALSATALAPLLISHRGLH